MSPLRRKQEKTMANQLSEAQANLIECLKFLKIKKDAIVATMLLIPKEEQIATMAEYLLQNPKATEAKILKKATEISKA